MVNHRQLIHNNKSLALMSLYGIEEQVQILVGVGIPHCHLSNTCACCPGGISGVMMIILHAISCMWSMKITVLNTEDSSGVQDPA